MILPNTANDSRKKMLYMCKWKSRIETWTQGASNVEGGFDKQFLYALVDLFSVYKHFANTQYTRSIFSGLVHHSIRPSFALYAHKITAYIVHTQTHAARLLDDSTRMLDVIQ